MNSIKNFLELLNANWVTILVCIGLVVSIVKKTINYFSKSEEEKIEIAKKQITNTILKLITDAEAEYDEWNKAGEIKRSQVIRDIYYDYPILSKVVDQEELIKWLDEQINEALKTLRPIVKETKEMNC